MDVTTWEAMVIAEPELKRLQEDLDDVAMSVKLAMPRSVLHEESLLERVWAKAFKPRVAALVGYQSRLACLQSSAAYDVAIDRLYDRLRVHVEAAR